MRKNNSKTLKKPSATAVPAKGARRSSASTRADNGSTTASRTSERRSRSAKTSQQRIDPDRARIDQFLENALELKNRGDYDGAVRVLRAAVKEFPDCAPINGLLGGIYFSICKKPDLALKYLKKATKLSPKSEMASLGLFHSLWQLDRQYDALEEMKRFQTVSHSRDYDEILAELREKGYCGERRQTKP